MSHAFFASYATLDNNSRHLQKVVLDLRERVRSRVGEDDASKVGFFAVYDGILAAQEWEKTLSEAARSARVIVLFCSNTYFNSEYCAKEFDIFRRRLQSAGAAAAPSVIVPVIWDLCRLPEAVARYQTSDLASFPEDYRLHGLLALKRTGRSNKTLEALTNVIARALKEPPLPPLDPPIPFDQLLDAFDNPAPYSVRVGALHKNGLRWKLDPTPGKTAASVVDEVTASQRLPWRALRVEDDIVAKLEAALAAREAVILLADAAAPEQSAMGQRGRLVDQMIPRNCVVLVGGSDGQKPLSPAEAQARLAELFPHMTAAGRTGWFASHGALESLLTERIVTLRMALVSEDPATKLEDASLVEAAGRVGISLTAPALVTGPGGPTS